MRQGRLEEGGKAVTYAEVHIGSRLDVLSDIIVIVVACTREINLWADRLLLGQTLDGVDILDTLSARKRSPTRH